LVYCYYIFNLPKAINTFVFGLYLEGRRLLSNEIAPDYFGDLCGTVPSPDP